MRGVGLRTKVIRLRRPRDEGWEREILRLRFAVLRYAQNDRYSSVSSVLDGPGHTSRALWDF
jgi:hypothetical protein